MRVHTSIPQKKEREGEKGKKRGGEGKEKRSERIG
jgi:hypothetical protein